MFLTILAFNALVLIVDTLMWVMNGSQGIGMREGNLIITMTYYILNPIPCMLWSLYADYMINNDVMRLKRITLPLSVPMLINTALSVTSLLTGYTFYIDSNNVYHRGSFFLAMALICYLYLFYTFVYIIKNKRKIDKNDYHSLMFFAIPPFIGGLLQTFFYGLSLVWVCMAISMLVIFINIQNNQLYTDYLTGLFNRRQLDKHLIEYNIKSSKKYSII